MPMAIPFTAGATTCGATGVEMTICGGVTIGEAGAVTGVVGAVTAGVVGPVITGGELGIVIGGIAMEGAVVDGGTVGATVVVELDVGGAAGATVVGGAAGVSVDSVFATEGRVRSSSDGRVSIDGCSEDGGAIVVVGEGGASPVGAASSIVVDGIALPASTCSDSTAMSGLSLDALIVGVCATSELGGDAMCTSVSERG
jgi:hypothetical protein